MLMAQRFASTRATFTPGARRRRSGILVAPERRISSCVITKIAAPAFDSFCSFFETDVTGMVINSSRLSWDRSGPWGGCAQPGKAARAATRPRRGRDVFSPMAILFGLSAVEGTTLGYIG